MNKHDDVYVCFNKYVDNNVYNNNNNDDDIIMIMLMRMKKMIIAIYNILEDGMERCITQIFLLSFR